MFICLFINIFKIFKSPQSVWISSEGVNVTLCRTYLKMIKKSSVMSGIYVKYSFKHKMNICLHLHSLTQNYFVIESAVWHSSTGVEFTIFATNLELIKQPSFRLDVYDINTLRQTITFSWLPNSLTENIFQIESAVWKSSKDVEFTI